MRLLLALCCLALLAPRVHAEAEAPPVVPGVYRFTAQAGDGHRHAGLLRIEPLDAERFAVTHTVRCGGRRIVLEGVGRRSSGRRGAPRLAVRFAAPGATGRLAALAGAAPAAVYGAYQLGPTLLLGVVHDRPCGGGEPGWVEERGPAAPVRRLEAGDPAARAEPAAPRPAPARLARAPEPVHAIDAPLGAASLPDVLRTAVAVAQRELAAGVREEGARDRGPRVDLYATQAGMAPGQAWCGFFLEFCYREAARAHGLAFAGQGRLHSTGKARAFFLYRVYTQRWTADRVEAWEAERAAHGGLARRFVALRGSSGRRYARARGLEVEEVDDVHALPIGPGDAVLWSWGEGRGHIGIVEAYDAARGVLTTIEGNSADRVRRRRYDLTDPAQRARIDGFGRPAAGDFRAPAAPPAAPRTPRGAGTPAPPPRARSGG